MSFLELRILPVLSTDCIAINIVQNSLLVIFKLKILFFLRRNESISITFLFLSGLKFVEVIYVIKFPIRR